MASRSFDNLEEAMWGRRAAYRMVKPRVAPPPKPVNEFEQAARERKVARLIERLDRNAGHQVTADEVMAMSREQINAACSGEKRQPSNETIAALAAAIVDREVR